ncbi:MAG: MobC family plasmid mobilization relaxosome protein [Microbacteriaceae bacterium]
MTPRLELGLLRWARGGGTVMEGQDRGVFGRRRRANVLPGEKRSKRYPVTVTPAEAAELEVKAAAAGMSVPRLLHESAKSSHVETSTGRKAAIAELFGLRREVAGIATNLNQLARFANTEGTFPAEAVAVTAEFRALFVRVTAAVDRLAES